MSRRSIWYHGDVPNADEPARLMAVGIPGPTLDAATRHALERLRPGAVVLFRRNVADPDQLRALTAALHALPSRPLVGIDHEGGSVTRLAAPFTTFPAAAVIGRAGAEAARHVGEAIGRELASVGIDIDFAPVLDVGDAATSFLGDRAFSSEATHVAELGIAFAMGLLAGGVLPCGKHFPGHGGTDGDSHHVRPVIARSLDDLAAIDLVPFRAAVRADLPMLMSAHVVYPALDPDRIATLSPAIAGDLLRRELGFSGFLWSDDLAMRAVAAHQTPAEAAVEAIAAGVDGVLVCHDLADAEQAAERTRHALAAGDLPTARVREALSRMAALRSRQPAPSPPLPLPLAAHAALADEIRVVAAAQRA